MKITSGNYEVFDSGTVISFENESVKFHLAEDLIISIVFRDNSDNNNSHTLEFNSISSNELEIILVNFNNSLGTGNNTPIPVGILDNKKLYVLFRVYTLNTKANRTIHYCWYLGEEVQND